MLQGLWKLTWLEIKIFAREPMGLLGTVAVPVVIFLMLGRFVSADPRTPNGDDLVDVRVPVFAALLIVLSTVVSLVTIISIYRESGILKRLRATPLRPHTILGAHVLAKLVLTVATLGMMMLLGRRYYPVGIELPVLDFVAALIISTVSILSMGFLIASLVPTARFAQTATSFLLYPMIALSGLFVPIEEFPSRLQVLARALPLTHAVALLEGIWRGQPWSAHLGNLLGLAMVGVICTVLSTRLFRWE